MSANLAAHVRSRLCWPFLALAVVLAQGRSGAQVLNSPVRPRLHQLNWTKVLVGDPDLPKQFAGKVVVGVALGYPGGPSYGLSPSEEKRMRRKHDQEMM